MTRDEYDAFLKAWLTLDRAARDIQHARPSGITQLAADLEHARVAMWDASNNLATKYAPKTD